MNPSILDHGEADIPSCTYSTHNLHWDGSFWKCRPIEVTVQHVVTHLLVIISCIAVIIKTKIVKLFKLVMVTVNQQNLLLVKKHVQQVGELLDGVVVTNHAVVEHAIVL